MFTGAFVVGLSLLAIICRAARRNGRCFFIDGGYQESYRVDSEHDSIEIPDIFVVYFQWLKFRNDAIRREGLQFIFYFKHKILTSTCHCANFRN